MKYEILPSGSYRYRKIVKGKRYSVTFEKKPKSDKEIMIAFAEIMQKDAPIERGTFEAKTREYISDKENVLSPATVGGYEKILRNMDETFKKRNIYELDQVIIQKNISEYAVNHAPKTVKNYYGLISAVLGYFRPQLKISITLPQEVKYEPYTPTDEEIKAVLNKVKGTDYHIPFQLGVLGLRRSEICAATVDDIKDGFLKINKALVYDKNNKLVLKKLTKTTEGLREIYLPKWLVDEINEKGYIFNKQPHNLLRVLHNCQKELNLPEFRLHDLRHYYASYCHEHGMTDADIMASGGWASDYVMKRTYRHSREKSRKEAQKEMATSIFS